MKDRVLKLWEDDFIRHTAVMVAGLQLVNLLNFLFHWVMVRQLTCEEYGAFNALVILSFYFCQFTPPFQPALTRFIARFIARRDPGRARYVYRRGLIDLGVVSGVLIVLSAVFSGPLARWQNLPGGGWVEAAGVLIAVNIMISAPFAFLQGAQLFNAFAAVNAASALVKVAVGFGMLAAGFKVAAGVGGFIATPAFILIAGTVFIARRFKRLGAAWIPEKTSMLPVYRYYLPTGLVLVSFTVLTNMDVTLVKRFFSPLQAGYYSVAQMIGKIILFLPWAVSMVVFPKATTAAVEARSSFPYLLKGLGLTALFCGAGVGVCLASPSLVLFLLTGKTAPEAVALVVPFATAMSLYALLWMTVYYNLSIHNTRFIAPLVAGAAVQTAIIYFRHPTLLSILHVMNAVGGCLLALALVLSRSRATVADLDREVL